MPTVKIRLRELVREKALREGRDPELHPITQEEIASATGLSRPTVSAWMRDHVERLERESLLKFCGYLDCQVGDLVVIEQ